MPEPSGLNVEIAKVSPQVTHQLARAEMAAEETGDLPAVFARRDEKSWLATVRLADLVPRLPPRARFDAAAAVFVAAGDLWDRTKGRLEAALAARDVNEALALRDELDAIELEIDRARDALHAARRSL